MKASDNIVIRELVNRWEKMARRKWNDSLSEENPMGKKVIEAGALCYQNCAQELRKALESAWPDPLAIQEEDQK
jgi:hypothetical protein